MHSLSVVQCHDKIRYQIQTFAKYGSKHADPTILWIGIDNVKSPR